MFCVWLITPVLWSSGPGAEHPAATTSLGATPAWSQLAVTGTPTGGGAAVYDPVRDQILLCRGAELWALPLAANSAWSQIALAGTAPSARSGHTAIYDPVRDRVLVFGGKSSTTNFPDDVLVYSAGNRAPVSILETSGPRPPGRVGHTAIYDPVHDQMVVFGGGLPPSNARLGGTRVNDVWALSLSGTPTWTRLAPAGTPPSPRTGHTAIYDPVRRRMVVFGGHTEIYLNETWVLSLDDNPAWAQLQPEGIAPALAIHSAIYDPDRDRMVVFGGDSNVGPYTRVHTLSFASLTWAQVPTLGQPPEGRWGHRAVYDAEFASMIVFGGEGSSTTLGSEVWVMTLGVNPVWSRQTSAATPRRFPAMVYDPGRRRCVIVGGSHFGAPLNSVLALESQGSQSTDLSPPGEVPPGRLGHILVYDSSGDRMLMFGGYPTDPAVWSLALSEPPTWSRLSAAGTPPSDRWGAGGSSSPSESGPFSRRRCSPCTVPAGSCTPPPPTGRTISSRRLKGSCRGAATTSCCRSARSPGARSSSGSTI